MLIRGTALAALALYTAALVVRMHARGRPAWGTIARALWSAGCAVFLLHVGCAFHLVHGWSHAAAYDATARETLEIVGWNWGGGLYANYLFTAVWAFDAAWWWYDASAYTARPRVVEGLVQGFLGFMAVNATIVFGEGTARWFGIMACAALMLAEGIRRRGLARGSNAAALRETT